MCRMHLSIWFSFSITFIYRFPGCTIQTLGHLLQFYYAVRMDLFLIFFFRVLLLYTSYTDRTQFDCYYSIHTSIALAREWTNLKFDLAIGGHPSFANIKHAIARSWVPRYTAFFGHFEYGCRDSATRRDGTQFAVVSKLAVYFPFRRALHTLKHALP